MMDLVYIGLELLAAATLAMSMLGLLVVATILTFFRKADNQ